MEKRSVDVRISIEHRRAVYALGVMMLALACNATARAQMPRAVVFAPADSGHAPDTRVAGEVRAALAQLDLAKVVAEPPMDLDAMQLTLDCVGESLECLGQLAHRYKANVLIALSVVHGDNLTTLRIMFFDADAGHAARTAKHRVRGTELNADAFASIPRLLRALFEGSTPIEEAEPEEPATEVESAEPLPVQTAPDPQPQPTDSDTGGSLPVGPLVLGGGGVIVLGFGLAVGALMKQAQHDYAKRVVRTPDQAKQADADVQFGRRQALTADVLMGVGAAAIVAGVIWLVASDRDKPAPAQASLAPVVDRHGAMLAISGTWDERL